MKTPSVPTERIERATLVLRRHKVMLDADLAQLYDVEKRVLVQAVKRNLERFPVDFMFQLRKQELAICDLKLGRTALSALCFHGAGRGDAFHRAQRARVRSPSISRSCVLSCGCV